MARQVKETGHEPATMSAAVPTVSADTTTQAGAQVPVVVTEAPKEQSTQSSIANGPTPKPDAGPTVSWEPPSPKAEAPQASKAAQSVFTLLYLLYKNNTLTRYQLASTLLIISDGSMPENVVEWLVTESKKT